MENNDNEKESLNENISSIFGVSTTGPLHIQLGLPCQDSCAFVSFPNNVGIVAVSDGLGSAHKSDKGSSIAVNTVIETARCMISENIEFDLLDVVKKSVTFARTALKNYAEEEKSILEDYACTLIVVAFKKNKIAVAHIGDGAVIAKTPSKLLLASQPSESEYINEVIPLTTEDWEKHLQYSEVVENVQAFMAFTDGLQRAALLNTNDGLIPFDKFVDPLFSYFMEILDCNEAESDMKNFLESEKMNAHCEDDKTLVIAILSRNYENSIL
jgi:hypothetical protein